MSDRSSIGLSRRERQIMDVIYVNGQATAAEVLQAIHDPPSYSAVRALLRILEEKGHVRHAAIKGKYVYTPVRLRAHAGRGAMRGILRTFFDNSAAKAVAALLDISDTRLSEEELSEISDLIAKVKKRGAKP